jgi:hypothetical protein
MLPTNDPDVPTSAPASDDFLSRTRSAVLNVLVGVGFMIALSGWLIRRRAIEPIAPPPRGLHDGLLFGLLGLAVISYLMRRRWLARPASLPRDQLEARFYRSHVGSAAVAALGVPLGLAYGWFVDPQLKGVVPFWVVPIALGLLAFPRRGELDGVATPPQNPEAPPT